MTSLIVASLTILMMVTLTVVPMSSTSPLSINQHHQQQQRQYHGQLEYKSSVGNGQQSVWSAVSEFCDWESVNISCPLVDEVLVVRSARYGRLRLNRCVTKNYGHLGCGADVTPRFERVCSARRRCAVSVISLHGTPTSCPPDLKAYVELTYDCVKVQPSNCQRSPFAAGSKSSLVLPTGLLASVASRDDPPAAGTSLCPWMIRAAEYQRVGFTIIDFSVPAVRAIDDNSLPDLKLPGSCVLVTEKTGNGNHSAETVICGSDQRESLVHTSESNLIEISIVNNSTDHEFLIKYEAFGCPRPLAPPGGWLSTLSKDKVIVRCNDSSRDVSWTMTCRHSQWVGDVTGTCNISPAVASLNPSVSLASDSTNSEKDVFYGIIVIVSLGVAVGVTVGILMLVLVLVYQRRYKQRKINCRTDGYVMKRPQDPPLISPDLNPSVGTLQDPSTCFSSNEPNPNSPRADQTVTWSRCQPTFLGAPSAAITTDFRPLYEGHVPQFCSRVVPGTQTYCGRHVVCRDAAAWPETNSLKFVPTETLARRSHRARSRDTGSSTQRNKRRVPASTSTADNGQYGLVDSDFDRNRVPSYRYPCDNAGSDETDEVRVVGSERLDLVNHCVSFDDCLQQSASCQVDTSAHGMLPYGQVNKNRQRTDSQTDTISCNLTDIGGYVDDQRLSCCFTDDTLHNESEVDEVFRRKVNFDDRESETPTNMAHNNCLGIDDIRSANCSCTLNRQTRDRSPFYFKLDHATNTDDCVR